MTITTYLRSPANKVWAVLLAATLVTWTLGAGHSALVGNTCVATVFVILIAFIKVDLVGRYFMELNHAPQRLALLFHSWSVITACTVIGIYLLHR
ncbi:hypothetical protein BOO86_15475 [Mycobacterium sp. CBMA 234]|uniref:cytochrome C oxidase subunit IV family protein n=1 Tax=Mycolicibacterium sp. CBMA 234 TaxID=1918495 RepID=UPI0012DF8E38|nr:hypothetical protein [Mycolicibacterium sp. CBMA 234]